MKNTLKGKWGIDSNIIIYSFDKRSPFFKKAKVFFNLILKSRVELYITQQNILECEKVLIYKHKYSRKLIIEMISDFIEEFNISIICPLPTTIFHFHKALEQFRFKDIFDLFLGTTYIDNGIVNLFTNNKKDFKKLSEFNAVNPFDLF